MSIFEWPLQLSEILNVGISLVPFGINNWGLRRGDALVALEKLQYSGIPITGGDVLIFSNGIWDYNHDNWYYDQRQGENFDSYLHNSISHSRNYVSRYVGDEVLFSLVPDLSLFQIDG